MNRFLIIRYSSRHLLKYRFLLHSQMQSKVESKFEQIFYLH